MRSRIALLEAILFTTTKPLSIKELAKSLKVKEKVVSELLNQLKVKYDENSGITLSEDENGYRLVVKNNYLEDVRHLTPHTELPKAVLRVLSIIAYYEPIKQSDIVKTIGNRAYEYIRKLEKHGFVSSVRKYKTKILKTTKKFESYFGIKKGELRKLYEECKHDSD